MFCRSFTSNVPSADCRLTAARKRWVIMWSPNSDSHLSVCNYMLFSAGCWPQPVTGGREECTERTLISVRSLQDTGCSGQTEKMHPCMFPARPLTVGITLDFIFHSNNTFSGSFFEGRPCSLKWDEQVVFSSHFHFSALFMGFLAMNTAWDNFWLLAIIWWCKLLRKLPVLK